MTFSETPCLRCTEEDCYPDRCEAYLAYVEPRPMPPSEYRRRWDEDLHQVLLVRGWSNGEVFHAVARAGPHENADPMTALGLIDALHVEAGL